MAPELMVFILCSWLVCPSCIIWLHQHQRSISLRWRITDSEPPTSCGGQGMHSSQLSHSLIPQEQDQNVMFSGSALSLSSYSSFLTVQIKRTKPNDSLGTRWRHRHSTSTDAARPEHPFCRFNPLLPFVWMTTFHLLYLPVTCLDG